MKIGFIGLGIMGSRMAANLQKAGHELVVFNRTPDKAEALVKAGAVLAPSPEEVGRQCRLVFTMLSTPEAVQEVALGQQGFLKELPGHSLWVDCSTVNPSFSRQMAKAALKMGHRFLDAPVSGSLAPAENGQLVFLIGGEENDITEIRPLLDAMGKAVLHIGGHGQGASMKMVNNMLFGQIMVAFAEALKLGTYLGMTEETLCQTLLNGPGGAPFLKGKENKLLSRDFSPEFPLEWMHKDLHLAGVTAYEQEIALPFLHAAKELFAQAKQAGLAGEDFSAVYQFINPK
ncbi:NAD(P)-dependent oxidoreductase [Rufibacter quisquiliarum]|uniref:3-hydroxyisobutyrate dehydrogenase/glyoxylate/succinic semialdehyde reductase n=1 Tax=Rufibacter quisquiliarum TaxID=1549639 RepID=A0A839GL93_9BACT|nr:NAD(P)-dependent oxidoreductase [Rufibacter quisquiliarum]MBA9075756.1 3-hydroxyisobutyrate dehydrogenase/glyoxylate/succinic semialdehyde reductase [Rufibacter quisquiliarum]